MNEETIESPSLLRLFNYFTPTEFKRSKLTYYLHNNLFPFVESKVGMGYVRKYSIYDAIAMICAEELYRWIFTSDFERARDTGAFIRDNIEKPEVFEQGVFVIGGASYPGTITTSEKNDDDVWTDNEIWKAIARDLYEKPIPGRDIFNGGTVGLRNERSKKGNRLYRTNPIVVFPIFKIAWNVQELWDEV